MRVPSIYWGSSYYRGMELPHAISLMSFQRACDREKIRLNIHPTWGDAMIERSRGRSATRFLLERDEDVWLSVDSDIAFDPADALKLCLEACDRDVVGGPYVTRTPEGGRVTSQPFKDRPFDFAVPDLQEARWLATGFLAVHRRVFEKLAEGLTLYHPADGDPMRHYGFFEPLPADDDSGVPIRLSEDWAFCERARQAGFGVWMDPTPTLIHFGQGRFLLDREPDRAASGTTARRPTCSRTSSPTSPGTSSSR